MVEPLSERELDVLRLLGTDLDGPDIARELVVSLNTVRTHTKNIYAKLGVNNRRAAVRRAERARPVVPDPRPLNPAPGRDHHLRSPHVVMPRSPHPLLPFDRSASHAHGAMSETSTGRHEADRTKSASRAPRSRWAAWFDGLSLTNENDGTTLIHGPVVDQAALHGLLQKIRDIGLPLVSVTQVEPDQPDVPTADPR